MIETSLEPDVLRIFCCSRSRCGIQYCLPDRWSISLYLLSCWYSRSGRYRQHLTVQRLFICWLVWTQIVWCLEQSAACHIVSLSCQCRTPAGEGLLLLRTEFVPWWDSIHRPLTVWFCAFVIQHVLVTTLNERHARKPWLLFPRFDIGAYGKCTLSPCSWGVCYRCCTFPVWFQPLHCVLFGFHKQFSWLLQLVLYCSYLVPGLFSANTRTLWSRPAVRL